MASRLSGSGGADGFVSSGFLRGLARSLVFFDEEG